MEFDAAVAELDTLVTTLERDGDERALMLLQLIDAIHRPALERIVAGDVEHPLARALLMMYDLLPADELLQVEEALDEIRPYIESHGGGLEVLDVDGGVVHVRMHGACNGCAASAMTLRRGVEEKLRERLEWFTEVVAHDAEDEEPSGTPLPVLQIEHHENGASSGSTLLQIEDLRRPQFVEVGRLDDIPAGTLKAFEVAGSSILIANVAGEPYAFRNLCPVGGGRLPLDGGRLTGTVLVCPWHNCAYDARSGKRADDEPDGASLAVVPIAVVDGVLKVATNVA
jgi:Fe-S cluster biogenesis protein NfuA/nitrite reductase/ring-hydroxylating ferredoxin subunit